MKGSLTEACNWLKLLWGGLIFNVYFLSTFATKKGCAWFEINMMRSAESTEVHYACLLDPCNLVQVFVFADRLRENPQQKLNSCLDFVLVLSFVFGAACRRWERSSLGSPTRLQSGKARLWRSSSTRCNDFTLVCLFASLPLCLFAFLPFLPSCQQWKRCQQCKWCKKCQQWRRVQRGASSISDVFIIIRPESDHWLCLSLTD